MKRLLFTLVLVTGLALAPQAQATTGPLPIVKATWADTYLPEGGGPGLFELLVRNAGGAPLPAGSVIEEQLPSGVTATGLHWNKYFEWNGSFGERVEPCTGNGALGPTNPSGIAGATRIACALDELDEALRLGPAPGTAFSGNSAFTPYPNGYLGRFPDPIRIDVAVAPGTQSSAANLATATVPVSLDTLRDGGSGQNEAQSLTVRAAAGDYRLAQTTARGTGTLASGSEEVSGLAASLGAFHPGDEIAGQGIATGEGVGQLSAGSAIVSAVQPFKGAVFAAGQAIAGQGIAPGTTIAKVELVSAPPGYFGTDSFYNLTLSAPAAASGTRGLFAHTTVIAAGGGTLTLSAKATVSGSQALSASEATEPIESDASAAEVQAALAALPGIGAGDVAVTGGPGDAAGSAPYTVTFAGTLANTDLPQLAPATGPEPLGGGTPAFKDEDQVPFANEPSPFGLVPGSFISDFYGAAFPFGSPSRLAGDHPFEYRFNFDLNRHDGRPDLPGASPNALLRTVVATLPRGAIGNPEALPKCPQADFAQQGAYASGTGCPADTQVGYLTATLQGGPVAIARAPIYSLEPPHGTPVDFGFTVGGFVQGHIFATPDPAQDYAIKTITPDIGALVAPLGAEVTVWGVPADPAHDFFRAYPAKQPSGESEEGGGEVKLIAGAPWGSAPVRPFFTNPMDCGAENGGSRVRVESYSEPGVLTPAEEYGEADDVEKCDDQRFRFKPEVSLTPTDLHAGAPTGLDVHLKVPQSENEVKGASEAWKLYAKNKEPQGISTPPIKKAVVTLPQGMTLNTSAAQGLGSCTLAQIGIEAKEGRYVPNDKPVRCPDSSQYGTLTLHTPILPVNAQPEGHIYIARQDENPFGSFLALYLVIEEPARGILIKIPGEIKLDPETGQITTSFDDLPQFPVSDMQMTLKGGVRAGLVEPATCGEKTIRAEFFTWQDPGTPHPQESSYAITQKPDGSPCVNSLAERPFAPQLHAATESNAAGSYSPFVLRLTRTDEDQELSRLSLTLPPGLAAKFAGVGICPDSGIAQALSREKVEGDGALERADPSCPASSEVGTTMVGAGVGVPLSWVPGKLYLAGPYEGAPMSIVAISPAIVGPYDLGVITVRSALEVNPETAQGEAVSDPFPLIFQGIPVRIRDLRLRLDRPEFTLNPTNCEEMRVKGHVTGTGGDLSSAADDTGADLEDRFQAADCASLGFHPKLSFRLFGKTKRGGFPRLKAVVRMPRGGANIARASVALPRSEFLEQGHIDNICTRVQFAAHECPAASIYGWARAVTPLFDRPLEGPVYLRSSSHFLPDLVAALRGPASQPVEVDLDGRIDSVRGGIRNSFEVVPDAPVRSFILTMKGGRKGLLVNSTDVCRGTHRAVAVFGAQNGRRRVLRPALQARCGKRGKGQRGHRR